MEQVLKNHVAIVLDVSSSMRHLFGDVLKVFNNQIDYLRQSSISFEQETRVSVYQFGSRVENLIFDVDAARPMEIKNLRSLGLTALCDAVQLAIDDFNLLPQKYGDHSFIVYVLTDGMENASDISSRLFKSNLRNLPENFTVAAFAPDMNGVRSLRQLGLAEGNIEKWDTTKKGIEEVGRKFEATMDNFYRGRKKGVRSVTTMFADLNNVTVEDVKTVAKEVKDFDVISNSTTQAIEIRDLVEDQLSITYKKGCAFYELVKNEHVQPNKEIAVQNKRSGKVYRGHGARAMLGLPNERTKVCPVDNKKWVIYIQSNAVNRKVIPKQRIMVF